MSKSEKNQLTRSNLEAWNQVAPIHAAHNQEALVRKFRVPGCSVLDDTETEILRHLGVEGKDVAQVCCNNGQELLSVKNMGAARCVGFDGAAGFIAQARELAAAGSLEVEFVCTDIYEIDDQYSVCFDIVTITIGVLSWMPDLEQFFKIVSGLLRPGGSLFIYEQHPILEMIRPGNAGAPITWELSYFNTEPYVDTEGLDYYGGAEYDAKPATSFTHTMSAILMSALASGLELNYFREYPHHISCTWWNVEHAGIGLPMCYALVMEKGA